MMSAVMRQSRINLGAKVARKGLQAAGMSVMLHATNVDDEDSKMLAFGW
jgi:hypothetical protein